MAAEDEAAALGANVIANIWYGSEYPGETADAKYFDHPGVAITAPSGGDTGFERLVATVVGLVENPSAGLDLPLDIRGTAFQQRVWEALRRIPAGSTATYAEIAERIGEPGSARAVARACGANSLAVAIPCHRVIRTDGELSGYRWGVERKGRLLRREKGTA